MDTNGSQPRGDGNGLHHEEEIVIVGGGIGGLACALALHRVGIKAVVLEQSDTLRAEGSAIGLWNNAFSVLDVLGIGEQFRTMFSNLVAWEILNSRGKSLVKVVFADCEGGFFLKFLLGSYPQGQSDTTHVRLVSKKSESRTGITEVELQDGLTYSAKAVIGFDGINSCVVSSMGLQKAQPVGQVGIRGMAIFPEGHKFENEAHLFLGKGVRTAYLPTSPTKVFWFLAWNDSSQDWRNMSKEQMKEEALQQGSKSFPSTPMPFIMFNTPPERITKSTLRHRLNTNPEFTRSRRRHSRRRRCSPNHSQHGARRMHGLGRRSHPHAEVVWSTEDSKHQTKRRRYCQSMKEYTKLFWNFNVSAMRGLILLRLGPTE